MSSLSTFLNSIPNDDLIYQTSKSRILRASKEGEEIPMYTQLAPMNAELTFSQNPSNFKTPAPHLRASRTPLPENWNNYTPQGNNPQKYLLSTRPENQQKCGSCFAFASATTINDVFVFGKNMNFNPDISPMSIMACIKDPAQQQCNGGNPMPILNHISNEGITTNNCMNYTEICDQYSACHTLEKKAFDEKNQNTKMIIPPCGCCQEEKCNNSNFKYFIEKPVLVSVNDARDENGNIIPGHIDGVELIKQHLYTYGSAVCGFIVYANFVHDKSNGDFEKTRGIYIESENYMDMDKNKNLAPNKILGCHAVVIVGWGIEKNEIKLEDGTIIKETPYWIIRNSWGTKWGLNGYFKLAMYQKVGEKEINPTTCFERYHNLTVEGKKYIIGGVILIKPSSFQEYNEKSTCKTSNCTKDPSPFDNKQDNVEDNKLDSKLSSVSSTSPNYTLIILGVLVVLFMVFIPYLIKKWNSNQINF